ncbi:hypothetical protein KSP39_PZI021840 [Platanthera zijinensis]|uniref:Uncharacterized protein n=1 Tax=Platanthera zijinensis TaxID=2320716 RepID=A0AAP0FWB0_9ASPA
MGAGLVFLLAKSATEFNRMVELRSEMETMLKYIKDEIQIKASASDLAESKAHSFFPNSNYWESGNSNKLPNDDSESCNFRFGAMEIHRQPHRRVDMDAKLCSKKGCEMEEELQVELQRLQFHLEGQGSSTHPHQDRLFEVDTESSGSFADANQQVNEAKAEANKHAGVCPLELERRLHELLEARQHERIAELETALECAARKLDEKEVEICWWRDTARLVTKHREQRLLLQF